MKEYDEDEETRIVRVCKTVARALATGLLDGYGYNPIKKKGGLYMYAVEHASVLALTRKLRPATLRKQVTISPPQKYCICCGRLVAKGDLRYEAWAKWRRCDECLESGQRRKDQTRFCMRCGGRFSVAGLPRANRAVCGKCKVKTARTAR